MRKKICFFSGDITRSGGTERVAIQIANALWEDPTYEICFMSLTEQQKKPFYPLVPGIRRYRLGEKWIKWFFLLFCQTHKTDIIAMFFLQCIGKLHGHSLCPATSCDIP